MKIFRFPLHVYFFLILLSVSACDDPPSAVGIDTIPQSDLSPAKIDTFYATTHQSKKDLLYSYGLDRTMLGMYTGSNQWKYEAWTCLKFSYWPDSLLSVIVDTAKIQFKIISCLGDTTLPLDFSVYKAIQPWGTDSLSYDSLRYPGTYYGSAPLPVQIHEDTGWVTIEISDTGMVRTWMSSNIDSTHLNNGLVLRPNISNVVKNIYSLAAYDETVRPRLSITYHRADSVKEYTRYVHSTGISLYVSDVNIPSTAQLATDSMIYIQNGISIHGQIEFDTLLLSQHILVYGAVLEMTLHPALSRIDNLDLLLAYQTSKEGSIDSYYYFKGYPSTNAVGSRVYTFNVINLISGWITGTQKKGLTLVGYSEGLSFDLFTLYGSSINTPVQMRPRLILTYFVKQ